MQSLSSILTMHHRSTKLSNSVFQGDIIWVRFICLVFRKELFIMKQSLMKQIYTHSIGYIVFNLHNILCIYL